MRLGLGLLGDRRTHGLLSLSLWSLASPRLQLCRSRAGCNTRASGHSRVSRKQLCWEVGRAPPLLPLTPLGKEGGQSASPGWDKGPAVVLLGTVPQLLRVPGWFQLVHSPWYPCLLGSTMTKESRKATATCSARGFPSVVEWRPGPASPRAAGGLRGPMPGTG